MKICILLNLKNSFNSFLLNKKTLKKIQFRTSVKEISLLETSTENNLKWVKTSRQKNYLSLIRIFEHIRLFKKIRGESRGHFLSCSTFEQFTNSFK